MKIFKWYLIDDIELRCFENGLIKELKQRLDIAEKDNWGKYLLIQKLEEENKGLRNLLCKKTIQEIGGLKEVIKSEYRRNR